MEGVKFLSFSGAHLHKRGVPEDCGDLSLHKHASGHHAPRIRVDVQPFDIRHSLIMRLGHAVTAFAFPIANKVQPTSDIAQRRSCSTVGVPVDGASGSL